MPQPAELHRLLDRLCVQLGLCGASPLNSVFCGP